MQNLPAHVIERIDARIAAAREGQAAAWARILDDARIAGSLPVAFACSEFVADACLRNPSMLLEWLESGALFEPLATSTLRAQIERAVGDAADDAALLAALRSFRRRHMVRIAWRDLAGWADLDETLRELSALADASIQFAHDRAFHELTARYGVPRGAESRAEQALVILGMGKLGGGELNYSSDIDLVFLYPEEGETDGERVLDNSEFFLRLGQRIVQLLAQKTADGFVYRVDMRLRPFGDSGRLAVSFDSFENYLQEHGRDWERYAYVKARPITGVEHRQALYDNLIRPFVYRRYLDFGVFQSLREMKALIEREVARRELQDNVKLGPGGIREIEFIVQAFQLIRGGGDPRLQSRELRTALPLLSGQKLLPHRAVAELTEAYAFLRRLENRLQEYGDEQTHQLPDDEAGRDRLSWAMRFASWPQLHEAIVLQRGNVARHFANIVFGPIDREDRRLDSAADAALDLEQSSTELAAMLQALNVAAAEACAERLKALRDSAYYRRLDETGRRRLHVLLPLLLRQLTAQAAPEATLTRVLRVVEMIGGRTVYLALLGENALALRRLVDLCARSEFLAEQIAAFPLLLDELIDERLFDAAPTRAQFASELAERVAALRDEDEERRIEALRQFQRIAMFRVAVADFSGHLPLMKISDRLTDLAELLVGEALKMAWEQLVARHGAPRCEVGGERRDAKVIVVAYGKFGGIELGYGSDLDLVFLHDSDGERQQTDGAQSLDNTVFFARLGQRLVHLLTTHTRAGRLYEVDIRLRPSGKGGLLVQSLRRFDEYQRNEAWTWEHQALLRARAVAGEPTLAARFEQVRVDILRHAVRRETLQEEVRKMRERMRAELSKAKSGQFDLKQDAGGIADLEFLTQYWMLKWADRYPPIVTFSDNIRQLESLASGGIVAQGVVDILTATYRKYRERMHHLSLAGGDEVIADSEFVQERTEVTRLWNDAMADGAQEAAEVT